MVSIFAKINNGGWIRALKIPLEDIKRLTYRPLKWLRFVAFATLGVKGHLHYDNSDDGVTVEYETATDLAEDYYFFPEGTYYPVDPQGLNECSQSFSSTCLATFNQTIAPRDGSHCVVTGDPDYDCAHIIPHAKGNQFLQYIIWKRRGLYDLEDLEHSVLDIDSPKNGMLLKPDLHRRFGKRKSVFLKTPNFALETADVPIVDPVSRLIKEEGSGEIPPFRVTLQHLKPPPTPYTPPQLDVLPSWSELGDAPLSILLDYAYGVAVVSHWASGEVQAILDSLHKDDYKIRLRELRKKKKSFHSTPADVNPDSDHPTNVHYNLRKCHVYVSKDFELSQAEAMDTAFQFALPFSGPYEPGTTVDMIYQQQEEEAEMRSQQIAQEKVQRWLEASKPFPDQLVVD